MKKFVNSYAFLALGGLLLQAVGAFLVGATILSRYGTSTDLSSDSLPTSALTGGLSTMAAVLFFSVIGSGLRFLAYRRIDNNGVTSRVAWVLIAAVEAAYAALILWLTWGATEPVVDAGFAWLAVTSISIVAAIISAALFAAAATIRPRKAAEPTLAK
jgi:hypothetical protein